MQYMLLLYNDEREWAALSDEERGPIVKEYFALSDELRANGSYVLGGPLQATTSSTTVRVRGAEELVTDGPFAETKEQLGGFYLIDVESLDEALAVAARVPAARYGSVEVRPILEIPARTAA